MRIENLVTHRVDSAGPLPTPLDFLPPRLREADYTEQGVLEVLGVPDLPFLQFREIPGYLWRCRQEGSARADLTALWLLGQKVPRDRIEAALTDAGVETLVQAGLLSSVPDGLIARADLHPCQDNWVFTDRVMAQVKYPSHVYELGEDSYMLARTTPRTPVGRALDLCTGSGIHAILAAQHAESVVGVDLNPRALRFARLNAALKGCESRVEFREGNLYEPVAGETFDLITVNPPFVPTPDRTMAIYRTGGESGEDVVAQIFQGLETHLVVGGTLAMVTNYPRIADRPFLERMRSWLGTNSGWGLTLLHFSDVPLGYFITRHLPFTGDPQAYTSEFERYLESYRTHAIEGMAIGVALARRLRPDHPGWSEERRVGMPLHGAVPTVGPWLDDKERFGDPSWRPEMESRPFLGSQVAGLWRDLLSGHGKAEFHDPTWNQPAWLSQGAIGLAELLDGTRTVAELIRHTEQTPPTGSEATPEKAAEQVREWLRELGENHLLN